MRWPGMRTRPMGSALRLTAMTTWAPMARQTRIGSGLTRTPSTSQRPNRGAADDSGHDPRPRQGLHHADMGPAARAAAAERKADAGLGHRFFLAGAVSRETRRIGGPRSRSAPRPGKTPPRQSS